MALTNATYAELDRSTPVVKSPKRSFEAEITCRITGGTGDDYDTNGVAPSADSMGLRNIRRIVSATYEGYVCVPDLAAGDGTKFKVFEQDAGGALAELGDGTSLDGEILVVTAIGAPK